MNLERSHLEKIQLLNDNQKYQIAYGVKLEDWKNSSVVMALFIRSKKIPVWTLAIEIEENRLKPWKESRKLLNMERKKTSCNTGKLKIMQ